MTVVKLQSSSSVLFYFIASSYIFIRRCCSIVIPFPVQLQKLKMYARICLISIESSMQILRLYPVKQERSSSWKYIFLNARIQMVMVSGGLRDLLKLFHICCKYAHSTAANGGISTSADVVSLLRRYDVRSYVCYEG